jgi:hypothetical protein
MLKNRNTPPVSDELKAQIQQYNQWCDRFIKIGSDVGNLLLSRYIFRESQQVILKNPKLKGTIFARWLAANYANSVALGIRRAVDTDRKAVSLANFLRELIAHPKILTRKMVIAPWVLSYRESKLSHRRSRKLGMVLDVRDLDRIFTKLALPGSDFLNISLIGQDLRLIQRTAKNVERFATKRLAHFDEIAPLRVTYVEIDEALDALDSTIAKYSKLFSLRAGYWEAGAEFGSLFADWQEIFEIPWVRRNGRASKNSASHSIHTPR